MVLLHLLLHLLFLCSKLFQKKDEGKAILLPASCDAGKKSTVKSCEYFGQKRFLLPTVQLVEKNFFTLLWQFVFINKKLHTVRKKNYSPKIENRKNEN
jgi:hypothetical protein